MLQKIQDSGGKGVEKKGRADTAGAKRYLLFMLLLITIYGPQDVSCCEESKSTCSLSKDGQTMNCQLATLNSKNISALSSNTRLKAINITCFCKDGESFWTPMHLGQMRSLAKLTVQSCQLHQLTENAFHGLEDLKELSINSPNEMSGAVMEISEKSFQGLTRLKVLSLSRNNIWSLPDGTLCSLDSLHTLNVSQNHLQYVEELNFASGELRVCDLPIESLDLSYNELTYLPPGAFGQLIKLRNLNLAGNNLNVVDDSALAGLESLNSLDLSSNQLVALPPKLFWFDAEGDEDMKDMCCQYLQELHLQNNSITSLAPELLETLHHLLVLNISRNNIGNEWLDEESFSSLVRLVALDLSKNRLTHVNPRLLAPLTSLQLLDLSGNNLKTIGNAAFQTLHNLHILRLSHNQIERLDKSAFNGLSVLGSLNLDHNLLSNLEDDSMKNCSSLVDINLSHNRFSSVPTEALRSLSQLKSLDLGENSLSRLTNASFRGLGNIFALRLAGNGIKRLSSSVFQFLPNLRVLNLAHNEIVSLEQGIFNSIKSLKMLRLDSNQLEDINGILAVQTELRWLNVSSNKLQWFDYAFIPKHLEWLNIGDNRIESLGNYYKFQDGYHLRYLDASSNRIRKLEQLSLLQSLEEIILDANKIRHVSPTTFQGKSRLKLVRLTSNAIKQMQASALSTETFHDQESSPRFFLSGNPFLCNCEMDWLQKLNVKPFPRQSPIVADMDDIKCRVLSKSNSSAVNIRHLKDLQPSEFFCQYKAHCFALCKCCDFFACDCRMQCPQGCSCFHDSTWSANVIQCSNRGHEGVPPLIPMDATSIYLDGNNFTGILASQAFIGRKRVLELFLNHSRIESINNQTFNGLTELLWLHLQGNLLRRLEGYEFGNLTSLQRLYLQDNLISTISNVTFSRLASLRELNLAGNKLASYHVWNLQKLTSLTSVSLARNPWNCACDFIKKFRNFARQSQQQALLVRDLEQIQCLSAGEEEWVSVMDWNSTCSGPLPITFFDKGDYDEGSISAFIPYLIALISSILILICTCVIVIVFRAPLKVWLHSRYGIRLLDTNTNLTSALASGEKPYDAFISYSTNDSDFIRQMLIPKLEHEDPGYHLFLQHRDVPSEASLVETLPNVLPLCSKLVMVVSSIYLELEWTKIAPVFRHHKPFRPVIIMLEQISSLEMAKSSDFFLLSQSAATVVEWNDPGLWTKVLFHLPCPSSTSSSHRRNVPSLQDCLVVNSEIDSLNSESLNRGVKYQSSIGGLRNNENSLPHRSATAFRSSPRVKRDGSGSSGSNTSTTEIGHFTSGFSVDSPRQPAARSKKAGLASNCSPLLRHHHTRLSPSENVYHTIGGEASDPIYHTLEPQEQSSVQQYDTLGKLDVMLPNGQFVPATLVRNHANGKLVPLVDLDSAIQASSSSAENSSSSNMVVVRQGRNGETKSGIDGKRKKSTREGEFV